MSAHLLESDIEAVLHLPDGWPGGKKLTWSALTEAIQLRLGKRWSRQSLSRHARIGDAFTLRKKTLRGAVEMSDGLPPDLRIAKEAIARLEAENSRLKMENDRLLEQFARWAYNAYSKGVPEEVLNRPLPPTEMPNSRR